MEWLERRLDLPPIVWLVPLGTAVGAVVTWTVWCDSPTGAWVGAAFIVLTALLVISLLVEGLPHRPGWRNRLSRLGIATLVGLGVGLITFGAAFLGLYLTCPFF
jgi:hypothetical protein